MTRVSDRLLVQRVDDLIVVIDESTGEEVAVPVDVAARVIAAITYLIDGAGTQWAQVIACPEHGCVLPAGHGGRHAT